MVWGKPQIRPPIIGTAKVKPTQTTNQSSDNSTYGTRPQQGGNQETFGKPRRLISKRIWPSSKLDEQHEDRATRVCLQEADHSQHGSKSESEWKRHFASDIRALEKITALAAFHDNLEIPIKWAGYNPFCCHCECQILLSYWNGKITTLQLLIATLKSQWSRMAATLAAFNKTCKS